MNVSRRPHLICSAPSINHCLCCVPTDASSEHTQPPARQGKGHQGFTPALPCFSLLCAAPQAAPALWAMLWPLFLTVPFPSPCGAPHPTPKSAVPSTPVWVMHISSPDRPFGNLPSSHESLRAPLHVGQSLPPPKAIRVGCSIQKPPKIPQLCCCVCLGALGTLLLLNPLESLTPSLRDPLTLTNPATLQQTYLKISFKKLLALTFK